MELDEIKISQAIIKSYNNKILSALDVDVAIAGAGPAGMCCGYYLAKYGKKVAIFERKLSVGGGMWGGGIMFNEIVVQDKAKEILDEFDVRTRTYERGYYLADSIEAVSGICLKTVKTGAKIFNLLSAEDGKPGSDESVHTVAFHFADDVAEDLINCHIGARVQLVARIEQVAFSPGLESLEQNDQPAGLSLTGGVVSVQSGCR